jgi:SAM-dependent methyltransferase
LAPRGVNYGIDAPTLVLRFLVFGGAGVLVGIGASFAPQNGSVRWIHLLVGPGICMGGAFVATAAVMFWGSKVGKLQLRDRVIASIPWRGNEMVLDVGCGHGLMLIAAAKRLTTGKAVGVDLWQKADQAGNSLEATLHNVHLEQVADRVTLNDGDARKLMFGDNAFDVILSSWAIHNIYDASGRELAIREIIRVLKPGGRLILVDIQHIKQYEGVLRECHMLDIQKTGPNFLFAIPSFILTSMKPLG